MTGFDDRVLGIPDAPGGAGGAGAGMRIPAEHMPVICPLLLVIGVCLICGGLWMMFGLGWGLIWLGVCSCWLAFHGYSGMGL